MVIILQIEYLALANACTTFCQGKVDRKQEEEGEEHGETKEAEVSALASAGILEVIGMAVIEIAVSTADMIMGLDPTEEEAMI